MYICIAECKKLDESCDDTSAPRFKCCDKDPATNVTLACTPGQDGQFKCTNAGTSNNQLLDKMSPRTKYSK